MTALAHLSPHLRSPPLPGAPSYLLHAPQVAPILSPALAGLERGLLGSRSVLLYIPYSVHRLFWSRFHFLYSTKQQ